MWESYCAPPRHRADDFCTAADIITDIPERQARSIRRQAKGANAGVAHDRVHPVLRALQGVVVAEVVLDRTFIHRRRGLRVERLEPLAHLGAQEIIILVFVGPLVPDVRVG